jgi:hypothetical protein
MSGRKNQSFSVPNGPTVRLPARMRLARGKRERLWKGLERFVNCGDDLNDYLALGRAFPTFWPVVVKRHPLRKPLNWDPVCHRLFLFYRETLRSLWGRGEPGPDDSPEPASFLLGFTDEHEQAAQAARPHLDQILRQIVAPISTKLISAWTDVLTHFPNAIPEDRRRVEAHWPEGEFFVCRQNDFQRAFELLFRESWRARTCPRCEMFFIARKPKQLFCGTACSAGSRLESKRRWWHAAGARKRRKKAEKSHSQGGKR